MQKSIYTLLVLAIALVLVGGFFYIKTLKPTSTSNSSIPGGSISQLTDTAPGVVSQNPVKTTAPVLSVRAYNGVLIKVKNFIADPAVYKDPNNSGYYYLAGGKPAGGSIPPYQTFYFEGDQSFHVSLYDKPLAQTRQTAEAELMQKLGLTQDDMCRLNYWVAVGPGVDAKYDGKNLGWSFCPGATQL